MRTSLLEIQAREVLGVGDDWFIYRWEAIDDGMPGVMISGAVAPLLKSGKNKGLPDWKKMDRATDRRAFISRTDQDAFANAWEVNTGKCKRCMGSGETFKRWSLAAGTEMQMCSRCAGTGARTR